MSDQEQTSYTISFFDQPQVEVDTIPVSDGIRIGIERVTNPQIGIGGAYGAWGEPYNNPALQSLLEKRLGEPLPDEEKMNLAELGFHTRHHVPQLSDQENLDLELQVGTRLIKEAVRAVGWDPGEVQGLLVGMTGPTVDDYVEQVARRAGIPDEAVKVSIHKACDGSVGGLHLALNPSLLQDNPWAPNLAEELSGKKVLVGGIEGLSRFIQRSRDKNALQLFGNGMGMIGVIPGKTLKFLVGKIHEVFDAEGVLKVHMYYPHSGKRQGDTNVEISQAGDNHFRVAGLMHQPEDGAPVEMAGPMGMVKLFVRTGVDVIRDLYGAYQSFLDRVHLPDKSISVAIVHHANYKINKLIEKHLNRDGIQFPMPWLLNEFGNVSAASNMIAFLRKLSSMKPGDHVLIDGFGAGTYYDAVVVEIGE
jgi:3-oxoacyl-[acyl-carrier-protein] synthase III